MGAREGWLGTPSVFSHTIVYHKGNYKVNGKIGGGLWFQSGTKPDLCEDYNSMELTDRIYRRVRRVCRGERDGAGASSALSGGIPDKKGLERVTKVKIPGATAGTWGTRPKKLFKAAMGRAHYRVRRTQTRFSTPLLRRKH